MKTSPPMTGEQAKKDLADLSTREAYEEHDVVQVEVPEPRIDLVTLRKRLGLTQQSFAKQFGLSIQNIRNWEQGIREPDRAARLYLAVIDAFPEEVQQAIKIKDRTSHS